MKRTIPKAAIIAATVLICPPAAAFDQEPPPPPFPATEEGPIPERMRQRVEMLLKWKIIEVLDLNEEQSTRIFPLYTDLRQSRRQYLSDRMNKVYQLKQALDQEAGDQKIKGVLNELNELDRSFNSDREKKLEQIRGHLSLEQWARYLIFEAEFPREIRNLMRERGPYMPNSPWWRR